MKSGTPKEIALDKNVKQVYLGSKFRFDFIMNTKFLKKDINNIKLSNTNSELVFLLAKNHF